MQLLKALKMVSSHAGLWPLYRQRQHLLLLQLLLLSIVTRCSVASPVSSPEIASKSNKVVNVVGSGVNHHQQLQLQQHQQQQHHQQQQQQQQQLTLKVNSQDPQLNSLSAYAAASYDGLADVNFKPSYKLPDMETNFTPLQSGGGGPLPSPTPVIMQYLTPQGVHENGVQYLQFIPTRPLIVPISSFVAGQQGGPYHQALTADNTIGEYVNRAPPVLTPIHANNAAVNAAAVASAASPTTTALVNVPPSHLHYGLPTYANSIQPYRAGYRFNREIRDDKHLPPGLTLNLNEYLPSPHELPHHLYLRGRP